MSTFLNAHDPLYVLGIPSLLSKFRVPTRSCRRGAKDVVREFEGVARMAA